ncbi:MAG: hypothetical protein IPG21_10765 [Saprospiraceae bacterium]|nr:hypothetical protein [Candidatus Vicinibacter affinis]
MEIQAYEALILSELKTVTVEILKNNPEPKISAKSRAGAEISSLLEEEFVKYTDKHNYFKKSLASPDGATKNPWDAMTHFCIKGHEEIIWIDFKAVKVSSADSNPDIGTPDKIFDLISSGYFYLIYIFVYYEESKEDLKFVQNTDNEMVKIYFLKDINHTFRRNPKNQLQVNISAKPEQRTREEFINLLFEKIEESHKRQIAISNKALEQIEKGDIKKKIIQLNILAEDKIKNL